MALPRLTTTKWPNIKKDPKGRYWVDAKINAKRIRQCCDKIEIAKSYLANLVDDDRRLRLFPDEAKARRTEGFDLAALADHFEEEIQARTKDATLASYHNPLPSRIFADIVSVFLTDPRRARWQGTSQALPSKISADIVSIFLTDPPPRKLAMPCRQRSLRISSAFS